MDDERAALLHDAVAWGMLASYRQRLHGDVLPSPYREVREAAERLLTRDELALVDGVVLGERDPGELPAAPGRDHLTFAAPMREDSQLLREAGVGWCAVQGWTTEPEVTDVVTRLDERRPENPRE